MTFAWRAQEDGAVVARTVKIPYREIIVQLKDWLENVI